MAPYRLQALGLQHGIALYCRRTGGGKYGDWLPITPPLTITEPEVDELIARLAATLSSFEAELREQGALLVVPLVGYLDRFSARPGERIAVKVSSTHAEPFRADLVRIISADPNPAGPGIKMEDVPAAFAGEYPSQFQPIQLGSCGIVQLPQKLTLPDPCTIVVRVQPRLLDGRPQTVLDLGGVALTVGHRRAPSWSPPTRSAPPAPPMLEGRWYELRLILAGRQGAAAPDRAASDLGRRRQRRMRRRAPHRPVRPHPVRRPARRRRLDRRLGRPHRRPGHHPRRARRRLPDRARRPRRARLVGFFRRHPHAGPPRPRPPGYHGAFQNLPTRGVRGSRWRGAEHCWRHAPRDYAAVHLHADDLYDCGWDTSFEVEIPDGMKSGVYGVRLQAGADYDIIPFYVLPKRGQTTAPIAFLASTFTYQAYANHARSNADAAYKARARPHGAPTRTIRTSTPNTAPAPTTGTRTAPGMRSPRCGGRS